jgi:hypothetical protein
VVPPLDKIVLPHVRVIDVGREKVPNPNYGMTYGQEGAQEPAFLEGDVESITILVPRAAEELLYFAVDNGTLHISVVPHAAVLDGAPPSTGVLWEDVVRFFQEERLRALRQAQGGATGVITGTPPITSSPVSTSTTSPVSPTTAITGTQIVTGTPALSVPATPASAIAPGEGVPLTPPPAAGSTPPGEMVSLGNVTDYLLPLCIGGGLVVGLGAVGYALARRRKGQRR